MSGSINSMCEFVDKILQFSGVNVSQIRVENSNIEISIQNKRKRAKCPSCGRVSYMVRGRYLRTRLGIYAF